MTPLKSQAKPMRERMSEYITDLQKTIVDRLETYTPGTKFRHEPWTRELERGGGGVSYTFPPLGTPASSSLGTFLCLSASTISESSDRRNTIVDHPIEKAGVNISTINGILPPAAIKQMSTAHSALKNVDQSLPFFAAGLSLILHPRNPRVPGVHANYRYFEVLDGPLPPPPCDPATSADGSDQEPEPEPGPKVIAWWFGVITDMTPFYTNEEDFRHFHTTLKTACDTWSDVDNTSASVYPPFKKSCDDYLFTPHRHEHRGIGGVRFDDMDSDAMRAVLSGQQGVSEETIARLSSQEALYELVKSLGDSFLPSFEVILQRRKDAPFVPSERRWQLLRRGRAVEFNLVVDRGTKFGLAAPGVMAENVLVGMPPEARWEYCSDLGAEDQDTEESKMLKILKEPRSWVD